MSPTEAITKLLALADLLPNWNGYDALPISGRAIDDAEAWIKRWLPADIAGVCPVADGSVQVDLCLDPAAWVGFPGDGTFGWYVDHGVQDEGDGYPLDGSLPAELARVLGNHPGDIAAIPVRLPEGR